MRKIRSLQRGQTHLPGVNKNVIRIIGSVQDADSNNIVQPIILRVACLEEYTQNNSAIRLRWSRSLNEDICAIVSEHVVAGVWMEVAVQIIVTPVRAKVEECACD